MPILIWTQKFPSVSALSNGRFGSQWQRVRFCSAFGARAAPGGTESFSNPQQSLMRGRHRRGPLPESTSHPWELQLRPDSHGRPVEGEVSAGGESGTVGKERLAAVRSRGSAAPAVSCPRWDETGSQLPEDRWHPQHRGDAWGVWQH